MATYTNKYKLTKPAADDWADIGVLNDNMDIIDDALGNKPDLDDTGKIPSGQIPALDYIPTKDKGTAGGVASLGTDGKIPSGQLPSLDFIPTKDKGAAGGVASLGTDGKVPDAQIPPLDYDASGTAASTVSAHNESATAHASLFKQVSDAILRPELIIRIPSNATITVYDDPRYPITPASFISGVAVFSIPHFGDWKVDVTYDGKSTREIVPIYVVKRYDLTLIHADKTLANNTWAQIAEASAKGIAPYYWSVGDKIPVVINGTTQNAVILGFNHDTKTDGSKAGITFGLDGALAPSRAMHSEKLNTMSFSGSDMYTWLTGTILPTMPSDLQSVIKTVNKHTTPGNGLRSTRIDAMKLFLFAEAEVFSNPAFGHFGEGEQYSYFTKTKARSCISGSTWAAWWTRSPAVTNNTSFVVVNCYGDATSCNYATATAYARFGFCV